MAKIKNQYTAAMKAKMVFEALKYPDGISAYCREKGIRDTMFYKWKKQIEENAEAVFKPQKRVSSKENQLAKKLQRKDEIIGELVSENIDLKKKNGIL